MFVTSVDSILREEAIEDAIVRYAENGNFEFGTVYEANRKALLSYRFWREATLLPSFAELPIKPVRISQKKYAYWEKDSKTLSRGLVISRTEHVEKPFFQDLDKPLLVENEMNVCHLEYLYDNVRRSEDYGGDNHIYLSYDNINEFLLFLCVEDITGYLSMEKFIFLFGEQKEKEYPMDLQKCFGIDYTDAKPTPIRVEEIQRIFVNRFWFPCVGNSFFMGLLDCHKDILSIKGFGLSDFVFIYRNALCDRTVLEVQKSYFDNTMDDLTFKSFSEIFSGCCWIGKTPCPSPAPEHFFDCLLKCFKNDYKPKEEEWLKGIFLAYSMALGREFKGRISPAIKYETHFILYFPDENKRNEYTMGFIRKFKYRYNMVPIRYFIIARTSMADKWMKEGRFANGRLGHRLGWMYNRLIDESRSLDQKYNSLYKNVLLRFEDFKLYPKASIVSLCEWLDIPWDDVLMKITANGVEYMAFGTGAFDPAPLYKRYYNVCNPFDYYRIELVMSKYWKHFGYEPIFYKGDKIYTKAEIKKMFEIPFQFEQYVKDEKEKTKIPTIRKRMYELVEKRLNEGDEFLDAQGKEMVPIPWLRPKMELVNGELYH